MGWIVWCGVIPACILALCLIFRRPVRQIIEEIHADQARDLFRQQREWLEARFLTALAKSDPIDGQRWEEAQWQDAVHWARDRKSRRLLALIGVTFEPGPFDE